MAVVIVLIGRLYGHSKATSKLSEDGPAGAPGLREFSVSLHRWYATG